MVVAIAIWSTILQPGKKLKLVAQGDIRITNATLSANLADESSRTSVKLTYSTPSRIDGDDTDVPPQTTTVLCSLTPGKIEQANLDLILEEDEEFELEAVGKNTIYLSGNYVDQNPLPSFDDESNEMSDEDAYDLRDVSSDVEIDPNELDIPSDDEENDASRFEEVTDDSKAAKRPREEDVTDLDGETKLAKKDKKKNKKQKGEDGKPVATGDENKGAPTKANGEDKKDKEKKKDKADKKEKKDEMPSKKGTGTRELAGGIKIEDVTVGTGPTAKAGDKVSMRYIGKLDSGKVFDSNTKGKPFAFTLGKGEVIKGWEEGIPGMQVGGERRVVVPPKMGYGNKKSGPIPPGSTLTFEVKLLEIK